VKNKGKKTIVVDIEPLEEIKLPELEVHGVLRKARDWFSHMHHIVWTICSIVILALVMAFMPTYIWNAAWAGITTHKFLVFLIMIFSLIAVSLVWSLGQRIDVFVFMYFNMRGRRPRWLDWLMLGLTQLGNFIFASVVALILYFSGNHLLAYELILGGLTLSLVVQLMKVLIHRTRPYIKLENIRIVGSREKGRSFPSGHTCQAFFMATLLLQYYHVPVFVWFALYALAAVVGVTRIYVGMHYPRDVLGGAILGTTWGLLGVIVNSYLFG